MLLLLLLLAASALATSPPASPPAFPPAFPPSFSLVVAARGNGTAAHLDVNTTTFAMRQTGGTAGQHSFTANFCNASGMFAYFSAQSGCYYQRAGLAGACDYDGWMNSRAFLGLVHDSTFELLVKGISLKAEAVPGPSGEVVWMDRTPTCPNLAANRDDNVTLAANDSLLGWSRGSTIYGPPGSNPRSCTVANDAYMVTRFVPSSDIDSAQVGAFVAGRIAAQQLVCHPFQR